MEKLTRNRDKTTQRIVEALEVVIAEHGLEGVGVNRVAEKAGVSKVLIYRYFGGIDGLMHYYVKMGKLFPLLTPVVLDQIRPMHESDAAKIWSRQVLQTYRSFRTLKAAREVIKATIVENDTTADVTSKAVDEEMTPFGGATLVCGRGRYQSYFGRYSGCYVVPHHYGAEQPDHDWSRPPQRRRLAADRKCGPNHLYIAEQNGRRVANYQYRCATAGNRHAG